VNEARPRNDSRSSRGGYGGDRGGKGGSQGRHCTDRLCLKILLVDYELITLALMQLLY